MKLLVPSRQPFRFAPNTIAVSKRLANLCTTDQNIVGYDKACIPPGYVYLGLCPVVDALKSERLFLSTKVNDPKPNVSTVDTLHALRFRFLDNDQTLQDLKSQFPAYLVLTENIVKVNPLLQFQTLVLLLSCS